MANEESVSWSDIIPLETRELERNGQLIDPSIVHSLSVHPSPLPHGLDPPLPDHPNNLTLWYWIAAGGWKVQNWKGGIIPSPEKGQEKVLRLGRAQCVKDTAPVCLLSPAGSHYVMGTGEWRELINRYWVYLTKILGRCCKIPNQRNLVYKILINHSILGTRFLIQHNKNNRGEKIRKSQKW